MIIMKPFICLDGFINEIHSTKTTLMSLGGLILIPIKSIVLHSLQRDSERGKLLDPTNFDPKFFKSILIFTKLINTFTLYFRRAVLTCLSTNTIKIKGYSWKME